MYSIRTKILSIAVISLTIIGTAFLIYSISTTNNYKQLRLEGIEKTVAYETTKVNKIIAEIERSAIFYAIAGLLSYEAGQYDSLLADVAPGRIGRRMAVEYIKSFPALMGGGFWFEPYAYKEDQLRAGFYVFHDGDSEIIKTDDAFFMYDYDYHNSIWYREIIGNITSPYQVVWTRPYFDDSDSYSLMTTASAGTFNEAGELIAISTADWEIDEVVRELVAIKPTPNSFVLLCVPERDYVISSTRTNAVTGASLRDIPWDITASSFNLDGIDYMRFGSFMDNGWLLSIQIPVKEIFAEIELRNERFSLIVVIVVGLTLLLAYLITSVFINAPIKKLTLGVSQIEFGNLDAQINISSKDELGLLAKVFNKMTRDLKKSIEKNVNEHAEKERISAELNVAATIQSSMLPSKFPLFPEKNEFDLYASIAAAKEVCGDFYDFFFINNNNLVIVIADVSGKGIPAALFMVIAKTLIKNCSSCKSPKSVVESVNKKLCEGNEAGMFVTAFIGFYNIPTGRFSFVNAGHNPPLFKKSGASSFEYLKTAPCLLMGFFDNAEYHEEEIFVESGDILCLYTDGVTEAMNENRELFGEQRLLEAANRSADFSLHDMLCAIKQDVDDFAEDVEQADDITMLALRIADRTGQDTEEHKLAVKANNENLNNVIEFINSRLKNCDYSSATKDEINIAAEEVFMNIVKYAYTPGSSDNDYGEVCITVSLSKSRPKGDGFSVSRIIIKFEDTGMPYNPLEQPPPDLNKSPAERDIGGLGIFLVRKLMDTVDYCRMREKNVLVITKEFLPLLEKAE